MNRKEWQKDKVVIYVKKDTRKRMNAIGRREETSDDLINRLVDNFLESKRKNTGLKDSDIIEIYGKDVLSKEE